MNSGDNQRMAVPKRRKNVVVTAFPSSQEELSILQLASRIKTNKFESRLWICVIPLEYKYQYKFVEVAVPQVWRELSPALMVHLSLGQDGQKGLGLVTSARKHGYTLADSVGATPVAASCHSGTQSLLTPLLDVAELAAVLGPPHHTDHNPDHAVAEFTFYLSLSKAPERTLLVTVPSEEGGLTSLVPLLQDLIFRAMDLIP